MHDFPPSLSNEITKEQMEVFVQKVREVAPYTNERIDNTGSYRVRYETDELDVDIYIPVAAGAIDTNEDEVPFVSDSLSVLVRKEIPTDDENYSIVRMQHYTVYIEDMDAGYSEDSRLYDLQNNKWATKKYPEGMSSDYRQTVDYIDTQAALGLTIFTQERFNDVCAILDDLRPEQKV